jgi:hypothetical protein
MRPFTMLLAIAALMLPFAALTRAPWTPPGASDAVLRFSWRMSITAKGECRPRTQAELDALPVHMRTPEACAPDTSTYVLITRLDRGRPDTLHLLRGGVKGDRPLFVLEDRRLPPGHHLLSVQLLRLGIDGTEVLSSLDTALALVPGGITLVTLDAEARKLVVK